MPSSGRSTIASRRSNDTIGEDTAILDRTEQLNEEAMYAIYEKKPGQLDLFDDEEEEWVDLNEAEELLRQLRRENPGEYERIASLRNGIRTARPSSQTGLYVFCQAEREHALSLTQGQRYVLREIRIIFGATTDEDVRAQINILEKAFRGPVTTAINRELNLLRRNGVTGQDLLKALVHLYHQHNLREWPDRRSLQLEDHPIPKIVFSEGLV